MTTDARHYPPELEITPLARPAVADARVPGSKSITNRALVLAALSGRLCHLRGTLASEDTAVMASALRQLGLAVDVRHDSMTVQPPDHRPSADANLFVGNSGTTVRFLTAMLALGRGRFRLHGVPRMHERPIGDLLDALAQLGVRAVSEAGNGCPPVVIHADGLHGGTVRVKGDKSSQFLSALLLAAPFAEGDTVIEVDGTLVSEPYIAMTLRMLAQWGLRADADGTTYRVPGRQAVAERVVEYSVEPDASAASYFWAAAAITGGSVAVPGLSADSLQGDVRFVDCLEAMGCRVERSPAGITVHGGSLRGVDVDMNAISDTVMTLAAVALFADGPTTIRNVAHVRHKETDRIAAVANELRRLGAGVEERHDGLTIVPGPLRGCAVDTYDDHRMAMSLALVGLRVPGVVVRNPACVAKTYPGFFDDLERLRR